MPSFLPPDFLDGLLTALLARPVIVVLGAALTSSLGAIWIDRRKFAGRWVIEIRWTPEHAARLFGRPVPEPHSDGQAVIGYGFGERGREYWGLAYFELFSGLKRYAHLCVALVDMVVDRPFLSRRIPYLFVGRLRSLRLQSKLRERLNLEDSEFEYGPWSRYQLRFSESGRKRLEGEILLEETQEVVGRVTAVRTTTPR